MKISVIHPTARVRPPYPSLPNGWRDSMQAFYDRCDSPQDVQYLLVVHESNWEEFWRRIAAHGLPMPGDAIGKPRWELRIVKNTGPNTGVAQGNAGFSVASGDIFLVNNDDLFPPEHWDTLVDDAIRWKTVGAVLHCSSGSPSDKDLFIPQIFTRARYERLGYGGHPSYESMFVDNEFTEHARLDDVVIEAPHIIFDHRHPALGKAEMDDVYQGQNREQAYRDGLKNLLYRRALGFPRFSEPQHYTAQSPAPNTADRPVLAICFPGEQFSAQWVVGLQNLCTHVLGNLGMDLATLQGYTSNVYCTRMELLEGLLGMERQPDYVLWLDDDNILTREGLNFLLQDLKEHPEVAGILGWCWCDRQDDPEKPFVMSCGIQDEQLRGRGFTMEEFQAMTNPLMPVDWSGFPCLLIRFEVLKALGVKAFIPIVREDVNYGFTSEDVSWFYNAKQAGYKFLVDMRVKLPHLKLRAIEPQWVPRPKESPTDGQRGAEVEAGNVNGGARSALGFTVDTNGSTGVNPAEGIAKVEISV